MTVIAQAPVSERTPRPETGAVSFTASWPPVAAWGAGLITAALGAGAIVGPGTSVLSRAIGVLLVTLGLAFLAWGAASLQRGRMLTPRYVAGVAVTAVLGMGALLVSFPAHTSVFAVAAATALLIIVAACAASASRRPRPARSASVWGLLLAAAVLSVVVTPSLGAAQDAVLIRDDGTVPVVTHDGH